MNLESQKTVVNQSQQAMFEYLSNMENYEQLMPDNTEKFALHESGKGFSVQLKGLPKVGMKLKSTTPNSEILFESPSENFSYELKVNLNKTTPESTEVYIDFYGKFNPMIEMMAKSPLQKFINSIIEKVGQI